MADLKRFTVDQIDDRQCDPNVKLCEFLDEYAIRKVRQEMAEGIVNICHANIDNFMAWLVQCGKSDRDMLRSYLDSIDSANGNLKDIDMDIGQAVGDKYHETCEDYISGDIINADDPEDNDLMVEMGYVYDEHWKVVGKIFTPEMIARENREKEAAARKAMKKRRQEVIVKEGDDE